MAITSTLGEDFNFCTRYSSTIMPSSAWRLSGVTLAKRTSLALSYFHSLKEFTLAGCGPLSLTTQSTDSIYDDSMLECLHSLTDHRDLGKLKLESVTIGRNGSTALLMLLRMKESNLLALDLGFSIISDGVAAELASGLTDNVTLKQLCLRGIRGITNFGWQALFAVLRSRSCNIEELDLYYSNMNDTTALWLTNAARERRILKVLDLGYNRGVTVAGWKHIYAALNGPESTLERLSLSSNEFDAVILRALVNALNHNSRLRELDSRDNAYCKSRRMERFFSPPGKPHLLLGNN